MSDDIILDTDDRAAQRRTVTGWVSRLGHFYGEDERLARYDGATHQACRDCGTPTPIRGYLICKTCRAKNAETRYAALPRKPWDGEGCVYSETHDCYFSDLDELAEYCAIENVTPNEIRLVHCVPNYARPISTDLFCDDLPYDGDDIPDWLADAIDAFNGALEGQEPLSWSPGSVAATVER